MNPMLKSKRILAAAVLFVCTAVMFFLPSVAIPHKIFIPLTILALFSIKITPWTVTTGLFFSALGDLAGSFKTGGDPQEFYAFVFQMLFFALAHIFYIITFLKLKPGKTSGLRTLACSAICAIVYLSALLLIVPCVENTVLTFCVIGYATIITVMLFSGLRTADPVIAIGACLFVFSDYILAWNMFVSPINGSRYFLMVPYYLAQLTFAARFAYLHYCRMASATEMKTPVAH